MNRGGTSVDAELINNIFYHCEEAAIKMPTKANKAEGNCYVKEEGGYLRILYPQPPVCLHLPAWKEFYGFDLHGQEAWFDVDVDTEKLTFTCKKAAKKPFAFPGELEKRNFVFEPEKTRSVDASALIQADFYGIEIENGRCLPGPFAELDPNRIYDIDPRKK